MGDIRVRKAKKLDLEIVVALKREVSTILLTRLGFDLESIAKWQETNCNHAWMAKYLRSPSSLYVVEKDEVVLGVASLSLDGEGSAYFGNLYTKRSGLGLGSHLMSHRLGVVEHFNVDTIKCTVREGNDRARRFVEHYGFEVATVERCPILESNVCRYERPSEL